MTSERWLAIPGYEGRYCVSDQGNVMSMDYMKTGMPGLMKFSVSRGYSSVELQTGPIKKRFTVHRLVALAFIGPRPVGLVVNHIDGVKANNRLQNLEYVTSSENSKHSFRIGLQSNVGEKHARSKLTDDKVRKIRALIAEGRTHEDVAKEMGVSQSCITLINTRKRWSHVKDSNEIKELN